MLDKALLFCLRVGSFPFHLWFFLRGFYLCPFFVCVQVLLLSFSLLLSSHLQPEPYSLSSHAEYAATKGLWTHTSSVTRSQHTRTLTSSTSLPISVVSLPAVDGCSGRRPSSLSRSLLSPGSLEACEAWRRGFGPLPFPTWIADMKMITGPTRVETCSTGVSTCLRMHHPNGHFIFLFSISFLLLRLGGAPVHKTHSLIRLVRSSASQVYSNLLFCCKISARTLWIKHKALFKHFWFVNVHLLLYFIYFKCI